MEPLKWYWLFSHSTFNISSLYQMMVHLVKPRRLKTIIVVFNCLKKHIVMRHRFITVLIIKTVKVHVITMCMCVILVIIPVLVIKLVINNNSRLSNSLNFSSNQRNDISVDWAVNLQHEQRNAYSQTIFCHDYIQKYTIHKCMYLWICAAHEKKGVLYVDSDGPNMWTAKVLIRLRIRAVWSGPALSTYRILGYYIIKIVGNPGPGMQKSKQEVTQ